MAEHSKVGFKIMATVLEAKGTCSAGHREADAFEISCHDSGGLCGFFYHQIFPALSTFQFGGTYPWWQGDTIHLVCPDTRNAVTLKLERSARE
jgi:uncharacterized repeat protein (TIGR04076 family)